MAQSSGSVPPRGAGDLLTEIGNPANFFVWLDNLYVYGSDRESVKQQTRRFNAAINGKVREKHAGTEFYDKAASRQTWFRLDMHNGKCHAGVIAYTRPDAEAICSAVHEIQDGGLVQREPRELARLWAKVVTQAEYARYRSTIEGHPEWQAEKARLLKPVQERQAQVDSIADGQKRQLEERQRQAEAARGYTATTPSQTRGAGGYGASGPVVSQTTTPQFAHYQHQQQQQQQQQQNMGWNSSPQSPMRPGFPGGSGRGTPGSLMGPMGPPSGGGGGMYNSPMGPTGPPSGGGGGMYQSPMGPPGPMGGAGGGGGGMSMSQQQQHIMNKVVAYNIARRVEMDAVELQMAARIEQLKICYPVTEQDRQLQQQYPGGGFAQGTGHWNATPLAGGVGVGGGSAGFHGGYGPQYPGQGQDGYGGQQAQQQAQQLQQHHYRQGAAAGVIGRTQRPPDGAQGSRTGASLKGKERAGVGGITDEQIAQIVKNAGWKNAPLPEPQRPSDATPAQTTSDVMPAQTTTSATSTTAVSEPGAQKKQTKPQLQPFDPQNPPKLKADVDRTKLAPRATPQKREVKPGTSTLQPQQGLAPKSARNKNQHMLNAAADAVRRQDSGRKSDPREDQERKEQEKTAAAEASKPKGVKFSKADDERRKKARENGEAWRRK